MSRLALIADAERNSTDATAVVLRVHRARVAKRRRKHSRGPRLRTAEQHATERAPPNRTLLVSSFDPIEVADDGTCNQSEVFSAIVKRAAAHDATPEPLKAAVRDLHAQVVDGRISAKATTALLRELARAGEADVARSRLMHQ